MVTLGGRLGLTWVTIWELNGMDVFLWRGSLAGVASSTLAATHHHLPTLPKARHGGPPSASQGRVLDQVARITSHTPSDAHGVRDDLALRSSKRLGSGGQPRDVVGCNASPLQRSDRDAHRFAGRALAQHAASLGFAVLLRRAQRAKVNTELRQGSDPQTPHVATIRGHLPDQSTCLSTARSGTVELQRACALRSLPGDVEEAEGAERHTVSNATRCSISRSRSGRHGLEPTPSATASCVRFQHRTLFTTCAILGRTPKKFWLLRHVGRVDRTSTHDAKLEHLRGAAPPC